MKKVAFVFFVLLIASLTSHAQIDRANKHFEKGEYYKAIELYKNILAKGENVQAFENIANSYRLVKDFKQAEIYFEQLIKKENIAPVNYLNYGLVLKANNKTDEAKAQFETYAKIAPDDKKVQLYIESCDIQKSLLKKSKQYSIVSEAKINTELSEFCPVFYKDNLAFVTDKPLPLTNDLETYYHVYVIDIKGISAKQKATPMPYPINMEYHDGPINFNPEQNVIAITHVDADKKREKGYINRSQLFFSKLENKKWSNRIPFQYNSNAYSVAHACYSADGKILYFSSDMPGGFGGMDIYFCLQEGEGWSKPQNLGSNVNTVGDEVFPYYRKDDVLFFSSDGHPGFGGLDVFSATKKDADFSNIENLGTDVNSGADDFGIVFASDNVSGYFSSDRYPGKGYDDIYSLSYLNNSDEKPDTNKIVQVIAKGLTIAGNLLVGNNSTKPLANAKVDIVNEKGEVVQSVVTNAFGSFVFTNLPPDNNYLVKVPEGDLKLPAKTRIILTNKSGKEMQASDVTENGSFHFTLLDSDKKVLQQMEVTEADLRIDFKGKFLGENKTPIKNTTINLVNEKGEILQTTKTDEFGAFRFENLPADQNVLLAVDEGEPQLRNFKRIILTNSKNEVIKEVNSDGKSFKFSFLPSEKNKLATVYVDDPWLKVLKLKTLNKVVAEKQNITIVEKVYYNYGDYKLLPEATIVLDKVVDLMEKDSLLVIEISSHTDSRSSKEFNLTLSQKRANAAVDYILKSGIAKSRISGKGYGESKLINQCADGVECTEEEHAKNRRTEFQINRK